MEKKELVVSLIADHLISTKLVMGLDKLGLNSMDYYPHLPETIMKLMGIESEIAFLYYTALVEEAVGQGQSPKEAAENLFNDLNWMKEELHGT